MSKNTIELNKIGSKVKLTEDVFGTIVGISIKGENSITYDCGWWNGRSYTVQSFSPHEITVTEVEKSRIGFV